MSDLEFQRALSPDQLREAHSLLDSTACAKLRNVQVGDLRSDDVVDPGVGQASTIATTQKQLPAAEGAQKQRGHLNLAVAFYGLAIVATAALTLLSWSERALTPPHYRALPVIPHKPVPNQQPAQLTEIAGGNPSDSASRGDDQPAVKDAANRTSAIPDVASTAPLAPTTTRQVPGDEQGSRKSKAISSHTSAARGVAARKRFSRRHWRPLAESNGGSCFLGVCAPWQKRRAFYEPPRNVTQ